MLFEGCIETTFSGFILLTLDGKSHVVARAYFPKQAPSYEETASAHLPSHSLRFGDNNGGRCQGNQERLAATSIRPTRTES